MTTQEALDALRELVEAKNDPKCAPLLAVLRVPCPHCFGSGEVAEEAKASGLFTVPAVLVSHVCLLCGSTGRITRLVSDLPEGAVPGMLAVAALKMGWELTWGHAGRADRYRAVVLSNTFKLLGEGESDNVDIATTEALTQAVKAEGE